MNCRTTTGHYLQRLRSGADLSEIETVELFTALQNPDLGEDLIAQTLTAWKEKGVASQEIYALAHVMRRRARRVETKHQVLIDTAGTGAGRRKTFNVSTAAAFVIAGAGVPVAKHGNRAATSKSGSADVISELGINLDTDPATVSACLDDAGICFMFAPHFHSLSPALAGVRKRLGFPTIFNLVGPLCNPAGATHQVMGVWDRQLLSPVSEVLAKLGNARSWVVHGCDGLDEITLSGETYIAEVDRSTIRHFTVSPADFGLPSTSLDNIPGFNPPESATIIKNILSGARPIDVASNLVLINAAAAIYVAGGASDLRSAVMLARNSIQSGRAARTLQHLIERTNR